MASSSARRSSESCSRSHLTLAAPSLARAAPLSPAWYAATPSSSSRRTYLANQSYKPGVGSRFGQASWYAVCADIEFKRGLATSVPATRDKYTDMGTLP